MNESINNWINEWAEKMVRNSEKQWWVEGAQHLEKYGPDPNLDPKLTGYMTLILLSFVFGL